VPGQSSFTHHLLVVELELDSPSAGFDVDELELVPELPIFFWVSVAAP